MNQKDNKEVLGTLPPKCIVSPGQYIQGVGILDQLGEHAALLGEKAFVVADKFVWSVLGERIENAFIGKNVSLTRGLFQGETSRQEINRLTEQCQNSSCDLLIGVGGGKTLDTAKGIVLHLSLPLVILPTIASNDAPTSRIIVVYTEEGALSEVLRMPTSPNIVLVDTAVIAQAPVRFLVAGIGDALSTKFEVEQNLRTKSLNLLQGRQTQASLVLANTCYDIIRTYGQLAVDAVSENLVTEAVELVVEANIYHSGIGFESGGLAAAHAMTRGFSITPEMKGAFHGEQVAFGLLVQLVLENRKREELIDLIDFYRSIGLPCCLADLGLKDATQQQLQRIAIASCAENSHIYKMSVHIDEKSLLDAIQFADMLGRS
jgi:glycerol dehydrogenase